MKQSEFNHIVLPMRNELLSYALSVTGSADNAEDLAGSYAATMEQTRTT